MKKKVVLLGSTGSIGSSVLDVIRKYKDNFELLGISANKNIEKLISIVLEFNPKYIALPEENENIKNLFQNKTLFFGEHCLERLVDIEEADIIIIAVAGMSGLNPTISAINSKANKTILTANKESIVAAGNIINHLLQKNEKKLIPLDSEHNAIFNLLDKFKKEYIESIILTASGGPFLNKNIDDNITINEVLSHPTWKMGKYITVNSATMMNKGFEVIEAHYLFNFPYDQIKVLIHPQSIVHGIVKTIDGTKYLLASPNDMRNPIQLAMFYPDYPKENIMEYNFENKIFEFYKPDFKKFPLLKLAYEVGKEEGIMGAVLNGANEKTVEYFLKGQIKFNKIYYYIHKVIEHYIGKNTRDNISIELIKHFYQDSLLYTENLILNSI